MEHEHLQMCTLVPSSARCGVAANQLAIAPSPTILAMDQGCALPTSGAARPSPRPCLPQPQCARLSSRSASSATTNNSVANWWRSASASVACVRWKKPLRLRKKTAAAVRQDDTAGMTAKQAGHHPAFRTPIPVTEPFERQVTLITSAALKHLFLRAGDVLHLMTAQSSSEMEIWTNDRHLLALAAALPFSASPVAACRFAVTIRIGSAPVSCSRSRRPRDPAPPTQVRPLRERPGRRG